ncbi:hypothetical protein WOLCODRAFT_140095 [Wolfiporia cocos MD-104 SS10]|uniref:Uncharacterized protein n=1 Tax=Wolfiporia cocos (strain MD-104) TaxID=742152 RepID=A0A2H3J0Q0_WOLCO|nr:hypothetical protein WOLCODRAFT_140095 [Wolfiporia cocos MD-104 SS10]
MLLLPPAPDRRLGTSRVPRLTRIVMRLHESIAVLEVITPSPFAVRGARPLASRILQLAALALAGYVLDTILSFSSLRARVPCTAAPRASCPPRIHICLVRVS